MLLTPFQVLFDCFFRFLCSSTNGTFWNTGTALIASLMHLTQMCFCASINYLLVLLKVPLNCHQPRAWTLQAILHFPLHCSNLPTASPVLVSILSMGCTKNRGNVLLQLQNLGTNHKEIQWPQQHLQCQSLDLDRNPEATKSTMLNIHWISTLPLGGKVL